MPKRPPTCPTCTTPMIPILYGYPDPDVVEAYRRGEVALGGCIVEEDAPLWQCTSCEQTSGSLSASRRS